MIQAGSQSGQVHSERQGTGLATILQGDRAIDTFDRLSYLNATRLKAASDAAAKKRDDALVKLKSYSPEYFYKHKEEIQPAITAHLEQGGSLAAKNIDPFTASAPDAVAWQKEHQRLTAMAQASMQVKSYDQKLQEQLASKDPNDFTASSLADAVKFRDSNLQEIVDGKVTPPILVKKQAWQDAQDFVGKNMRVWGQGKLNASDPEVLDFVTNVLAEPANQEIIQSYAQKLAQVGPEEQKRLETVAKEKGVEVYQQMAFEDAKRYQTSQAKDFNFMEIMQKAAQNAEAGLDYNTGSNEKGSWRQPKKGSVTQSAANAANDLFNTRREFMTFFNDNGELPRSAEEDDGHYANRVKKHLAAGIEQRMKVDTEYRKAEGEGGGDQLVSTRRSFLEDIQGPDQTRATSAAKLLIGTKIGGNLTVEDAGVNDIPYRKGLRLELSTPMSVKDVKQQIVDADTGLVSDDIQIEERQGRKLVFIDLGNKSTANQVISRLYDNYAKETKSFYDPSLTEYSVQTASGRVIVNPVKVQQQAKEPATNVSKRFK